MLGRGGSIARAALYLERETVSMIIQSVHGNVQYLEIYSYVCTQYSTDK